MEWIPAHLGETQSGVAIIEDGSRLTLMQWGCNRQVDEHAKVAACSVRRPKEERTRFLEKARWAATLAGWIGLATHAANNGKEEPHRDTTAEAGGRRSDRKEEKMGRGTGVRGDREVKPLRPLQLGGHDLRAAAGGGWVCLVCCRTSKRWNAIAGRACTGSAARYWAERAQRIGGAGGTDGGGHVRAARGGIIWCIKCGSYAIKFAVGLAGPCRGKPANPSQLRVLARLRAGRHPRTNTELHGEVVVEVPGLVLVGEAKEEDGVEVRTVRAGMAAAGGRSTVGYLRRPGGARRIAAAGDSMDEPQENQEEVRMGGRPRGGHGRN